MRCAVCCTSAKPRRFERAIEVHISRLRKKTEGAGVVIRSIRGAGYLLAEDEQA